MTILYIVGGLLLAASAIADKKKTLKALKIALKKFLNIAPTFVMMLVLVSIVLYLVPQETVVKHLGGPKNALSSIGIAGILGSIAMFPGFIAFPLCGILRDSGVPWSVIAAFSTSLMLVGIVTFPVEKQYLGAKTALIRNIISFFIAIIISFVIAILYGEIF